MKDFFKICTIYATMWGMMYISENYFDNSNIFVYFIVQSIVLICLFKILKLQSIDIIIFCSLIVVLLMLRALECNILFNNSTRIIDAIKIIIPVQVIEMIIKVGMPFYTIFNILDSLKIIEYSIYIVPMYIFLLAYISITKIKN